MTSFLQTFGKPGVPITEIPIATSVASLNPSCEPKFVPACVINIKKTIKTLGLVFDGVAKNIKKMKCESVFRGLSQKNLK